MKRRYIVGIVVLVSLVLQWSYYTQKERPLRTEKPEVSAAESPSAQKVSNQLPGPRHEQMPAADVLAAIQAGCRKGPF